MATITKWGNSLAIRLPQHLTQAIQLLEGSEVDLEIVEGNLVIKPKLRQCFTLDQLVDAITPDNRHAEIVSGQPLGQEQW